MIWNSASEFFAMRGYGLYVWGAYAMTLAALLFEAASVVRRHRTTLRDAGDAEQALP